MDPHALRADFPILQRSVRGKPLVYLDNAATSQKPRAVIDALVEYYSSYNSNVHRGVHALSEEATERYEAVRRKVARFVGADDPATIVFTRNATEAINLVAYSWGRANVRAGDAIVLTELEHHSNLVPWQLLAAERGAELRFIPVRDDGLLDLDVLPRLLDGRVRLVAFTGMSNALGSFTPVAEVARAAHECGAAVLVDGAQLVPHAPVDVKLLGCDFLAFSAHKMLGPTGVGVLWARRAVLETMPPFLGGGDMISEVWRDRATWNELPWKFEAGTPNIADVVAFGPAIDYLQAIGMQNVRQHEEELTAYALERLSGWEDLDLYGPADPGQRGGVISFNFRDVHPHDVGTILDYEGIAVRAGHHCCQPLMRRLDVPGTVRASFALYNTREDVDALVSALARVEELFGGVARRTL